MGRRYWVWLGLVSFACASSSNNDAELAHLRREVHRLRQEVGQAKSQVKELNDRMTLLLARQGTDQRGVGAATPQERSSKPLARRSSAVPKLPVVRMGPKDEAKTPELGAEDDGGPPVMIRLGPSKRARLPVDHAVLDKPDPVLGKAKPSPQGQGAADEDYNKALSKLRKEAKPKEARELFLAYLAKHGSSTRLSDNVAYWLGECSLAEGDHRRAVREFNALIEQYPRSAKVPDGMLGAATALIALDKRQEAREMVEKLKKLYPRSEAAQRADEALPSLRG